MSYSEQTGTDSTKKTALIPIILWATQAVVLTKLIHNSKISAVLFPAFLISSITIIVYKIFFTKCKLANYKNIIPKKTAMMIAGISLMFLYHALLFWGLKTGPAVETNLMNFLWPLLLIIFAYICFNNKRIFNWIKEKFGNGNGNIGKKIQLSKSFIIKVVLALIGGVLLITHGHLLQLNFLKWHGPLIGLLAALCWATFSVLLKFQGNTSYIILFIFGATVVSFFFWIIQGTPDIMNHQLAISYTYLGIGPLGIAMLLWEKAIKKGKTHVIAKLSFIAPLLSTILLILCGFDYLNIYSIIGIVFIVIAVTNNDLKEQETGVVDEKQLAKVPN